MDINVFSHDFSLTPSLRDWAARRVRFAMERFGSRIRSVRVRLSDRNGPRGGVDQRCIMEARFFAGDSLIVETEDTDPYQALSRAARCLRGRVAAVIGRERDRRRFVLADGRGALSRKGDVP